MIEYTGFRLSEEHSTESGLITDIAAAGLSMPASLFTDLKAYKIEKI